MDRNFTKIYQQFVAYISVERGLSSATVSAYSADIQQYIAWLEQHDIHSFNDISRELIEQYVLHLSEIGSSARSVARRIASIHEFHRFISTLDGYTQDVSVFIKPPKMTQPLPDVLDVDEVTKLLDTAAMSGSLDPIVLRDKALLEFLYATGARVSEAVGCNFEDIDFQERVVRLTGKGDKQRLVPIGSYAIEALEKYIKHGRTVLEDKSKTTHERRAIFLNKRGKRLSRQSAWEAIVLAGKRAHLHVTLHPHTLRHSFATHLIQGGANVRTVQELLGHASVTTTQIYTHISPELLIETYINAHPRAK
ncbi:MAG: site-specific tyrosine recombinase XerD [Bifidobacteriaceae bacterium]|nr:site-specific tyrosine recombinase XerD [Bifidobacteriaceae bacterium]